MLVALAIAFVVRIPGHVDHRFRRMPIADSGACRSPIPVHAEHPNLACR